MGGMGRAYALSGRKEEALAVLHRALELDPNAGQLHYYLAELYRERGQDDLANSYAAKAKALGVAEQTQRSARTSE